MGVRRDNLRARESSLSSCESRGDIWLSSRELQLLQQVRGGSKLQARGGRASGPCPPSATPPIRPQPLPSLMSATGQRPAATPSAINNTSRTVSCYQLHTISYKQLHHQLLLTAQVVKTRTNFSFVIS